MRGRGRQVPVAQPLLRRWAARLAVTGMVCTVFGVWIFVVYQCIEQHRLEYLIQERVEEKIGLLRDLQHVSARVLEAERLERVTARLEQAGIELVPPAQPPLRVPVRPLGGESANAGR